VNARHSGSTPIATGVGVSGTPISPPSVRRWRPEYIPAYLSNGLVGIRAGKCPLTDGLAVVSGLAAIHPTDKVEGFARGPYPFGGDIGIDDVKLSARPDQLRLVSQEYDFSCGELRTELRLIADRVTAEIKIVTFCSRTRPTVVAQETRVRVDAACDLSLTAKLDPSGIDGRWLLRETGVPGTEKEVVDGSLLWEPPGAIARCGAAYWTELVGEPRAKVSRDEHTERAPLSTTYRMRARAGRWYALRQIASLIPSDMHSEPHRQATRMASMAAQDGYDLLRESNAKEWAQIWRGRVVLLGSERRWQALADAAYYYLHAGAHRSSLFSTSMFGLAYWPNYHYYRGQVMWDIEFFAHPILLLTQPRTAEALLNYRSLHLEAAVRNAAMHGQHGAQFPWAATPMHGEEGLRTSAPLVLFEQHVSLCVALAFARQVHVTADDDYLARVAWPVIEEVALWIESRWTRTERGLELCRTLGIAEGRSQPIDNPSYVNMAAIAVLRETAAFAERLGRGDPARWLRLADDIRIPMDEERRVVKSHERFTARATGRNAATPEALAGLFPVGHELDPDTERETIRFYLDRVDPYVGSPMLPPLLGVYAAWIGDRRRSQELFEKGYAEYVNTPFTETDEFSRTRYPDRPRTGPFTANLGGFLTSCVLGLGGLRIDGCDPRSWARRPPAMPAGWDGVEVERLIVGGRDVHLVAMQGEDRARLEL
jgi:trehalose/maltose hydrolase-like predicted phosphorylase